MSIQQASDSAAANTNTTTALTFSHSQIDDLIARIELMSEDHHLQIFQIIQNDSLRYSHNQNGVFVNLANAGQSTLSKIFAFVREHEVRENVIKSSQATLDCSGAEAPSHDAIDSSSLYGLKADHATIPDTPDSGKQVVGSSVNATDSAIASLNAVERKAVGATNKISRRKNLQLNSKAKGAASTTAVASATKENKKRSGTTKK